MSGEELRQHLHIVDTSESLTLEELRELKKLVAMSRTSKTLMMILVGIITVFGIDKILTFIQSNHS
jgi:ABC-type phosphate/phosphonate transport system permease subunit